MAASSLFSCLVLLIALCYTQVAAAAITPFRNSTQSQNLTQHALEGCIHLPILHSTNVKSFQKRGVQLQLANRSDVAYYAQRTF